MNEVVEAPSVPDPPAPQPPPLPSRAKPVADEDRIQTLDVIRGMAVFGILFVNIGDFGLVTDARYVPSLSGGEGTLNDLIWLGTYVLADTKFIAIFTMLFGAGIALGDQRRRARRERRAGAYYRRMIFLMLLGLAHGLFLWDGDILYYYSLGGLALYFAPRFPTPVLFAAGMLLTVLYSRSNSDFLLEFRGRYSYAEVELHLGTWRELLMWRVEDLFFHAIYAIRWYAFDMIGLMLIGVALLKSGFLQGKFPASTYGMLCMTAFPLGVILVYMGTGFNPGFETFLDTQLFFWGSALLSLSYIAGASVLSLLAPRALPICALAAVGRMALTNYLTHSVICTTLFYGYGFALYEKLDRTEILGIVLIICLSQLVLSPIWLRFFQYGPCEWVWRCATYWRIEPLRKRLTEMV